MSTSRLLVSALLAVALAAGGAGAQDPAPSSSTADVRVLLDTIQANRRALIAVNLQLTAEQGAKFWPLYERYQEEIAAVGERLAALVEDYTENFLDLSNDRALKLTQDYLALEADRIQVRRKYLDGFAAALPGRTVARFYQIENKMDALLRYDLAAAIPVIEEKPSPAAEP